MALGRDVREPRLLSFEQDGVSKLFMYFAVLGTDLLSFDPQKMMGVARGADGSWTAPRDVYRPGFIPWRTRTVGRPPVHAQLRRRPPHLCPRRRAGRDPLADHRRRLELAAR